MSVPALAALGPSLRPAGLLAIDLCDLEWARARTGVVPHGWAGEDWALVTEFSVPSPDRFVREMTTFVRNPDGTYTRGSERHENVMVDTARIPALLAEHGVDAEVRTSFGTERAARHRRAAAVTPRCVDITALRPPVAALLALLGVRRRGGAHHMAGEPCAIWPIECRSFTATNDATIS